MLDDAALNAALERHWRYSGKHEDLAHELYADDAVLEFPQSQERFEGVENFREWRKLYPAEIEFRLRKIRHREDLAVASPGAVVRRYLSKLPVTRRRSLNHQADRWTAGKIRLQRRDSSERVGTTPATTLAVAASTAIDALRSAPRE